MKRILLPLLAGALISSWSVAQPPAVYHDTMLESAACCQISPSVWMLCEYEIDYETGLTTTIWVGGSCSDGVEAAYEENADGSIYLTTRASSSSLSMLAGGGIYLLNPTKRTMTTLVFVPSVFVRPYKLFMNQDGDFVVGNQMSDSSYRLLAVTRRGGISTLLSSFSLGYRPRFDAHLGIDIGTGNYLVCDSAVVSSLSHPVLSVSPTGTATTWCASSGYGWYGFYGAPQNHRTGDIEGPYGSTVYRLKKGGTRTTLATLGLPYPIYGPVKYDLQTAPRPRWIAIGNDPTPSPGRTFVYAIDAQNFVVSSITVNRTSMRFSDFAFKGSRHIQTTTVAANKWDIHLSCPRYPGKRYAIAASLSGAGPGGGLADGRNLNLNPDVVTLVTFFSMLPGVWNPGPMRLDISGGAKGQLDLSSFPIPPGGLGVPLWIAMVVLDPAAPLGVAYMPDTYVMRL